VGETKKVSLGGTDYTVTEVEIKKRIREEPNEYELEDGTIIRVANPTMVVYRMDSWHDPEGNPGYYVKLGTTVTVIRGSKSQKNEP